MPTDHPPTARPRCTRCQRPLRSCLCGWITPTANDAALLLLQHPSESAQAKGSAPLLRLSLRRVQVERGEVFDPVALAGWLAAPTAAGPARCWLLFTAEPGAAPAAAPTDLATHAAAVRLVLLDGTWRQARRLLRSNPLLQALPRWPLAAPPPSRYRIRKAQQPQQRSTLEAACLALAVLERQPERYAPLLAAFDGWVAAEAARAAAGGLAAALLTAA